MKRILLDSNVGLLLIVGIADRDRIGRHRRLEAFDAADVDLVVGLIDQAETLAVSPNVWTEISNLLDIDRFADPFANNLLLSLRHGIERFQETYVPSREVISDYAFRNLGLSDAVLLRMLATDPDMTLLTIDVPLYEHARSRGLAVLNFHHLREARSEA